jgi:hypothetical protein
MQGLKCRTFALDPYAPGLAYFDEGRLPAKTLKLNKACHAETKPIAFTVRKEITYGNRNVMKMTLESVARLPAAGSRSWAGEFASVASLIAIGILFFWPILTGKTHFIGLGDTSDMILPHEIMFMNFLKEGIFPLWSPNNFDGIPLPGYPQFGIFYPITTAAFFVGAKLSLSPVSIYSFSFISHIVLLSIGTYWFARTLRISRIASIVAAVGTSYAPTMLAFTVWGNSIPGFSWWGFALAAAILAHEDERRRYAYAAITGLSLGLSILASPSQPAIQLILLIAGLFVAQASTVWRTPRALKALFGRYASIAIVGLAIGAIALLPVLEFANQSVRFFSNLGGAPTNERMSFEAFTQSILIFKNLSGFLVSELSHQSVGSNFIGAFFLLGITLAVANYKRLSSQYFWYLLIFSLISILYVFNFVLPEIFYFIPGLNMIREPDRYCQTFVFTASILAAMGLDCALRYRETGLVTRNLVAGLLFAVLAVATFGLATGNITADILAPYKTACIIALGWLLLATLTFKVRGAGAPMAAAFLAGMIWTLYSVPYFQLSFRDYDPEADIASARSMSALKPATAEPFRVFAMRPPALAARTYNANAASIGNFYDIFGYHNPILMRSLRAFNLSFGRPTYLSLLNVRYAVTEPGTVADVRKIIGDDAKVALRFPDLVLRDHQWQISRGELVALENTHRYGAAWLVNQYEVVNRPWTNRDEIDGSKDPQSLMLRTEAPDFDAGKQALVDRVPLLAGGVPLVPTPDTQIDGQSVAWNRYGPNGFAMTVTTPTPALLVVSELWYPGWHAKVNGRSTEIARADWLLRAIAVPAGTSTVKFQYRPASLIAGTAISGFGLILAIVMLLLHAKLAFKRRRLST